MGIIKRTIRFFERIWYLISQLFSKGNNKILGSFPLMYKSKIVFKGENNILYCEPNVYLKSCSFHFEGSNSVIYLGSNVFPYCMEVYIYNNSAFNMGEDNYINFLQNKRLTVGVAEGKNIYVGDNCIISYGTYIKTSDAHLIYDCSTMNRVNHSKSVYIGDHVWLGQDCSLLKGTKIDSGSILGSGSVISGKHVKHNEIWAGDPAKMIKNNIFWDGKYVNEWMPQITEANNNYADHVKRRSNSDMGNITADRWIYEHDHESYKDFDMIDNMLCEADGSTERIEILKKINSDKEKNRFVSQ